MQQLLLSQKIINYVFPGESGCVDGTTEALQTSQHPRIAACEGGWRGHVENASSLCAPGWKVCGWRDKSLLQSLSWEVATSVPGCYAINAAQDRGTCQPCADNENQVSCHGNRYVLVTVNQLSCHRKHHDLITENEVCCHGNLHDLVAQNQVNYLQIRHDIMTEKLISSRGNCSIF